MWFTKAKARVADSQKGAVIVYVAIVIPSLIALLALATDLIMAYVSDEQQENASEYAALAAINEYSRVVVPDELAGDPDQAYSFRLDAAWQRANQIAGYNGMISPQIEPDSAPFDDLSLDTTSLPAPSAEHTSGRGGLLIPGRWYTGTLPPECPVGARSCFLPNDVNDRTVNAFRVESNLVSPIRTVLASFFGQDKLEIHADASATATQETTNMMFAIDLSPSMIAETHIFGSRREALSQGWARYSAIPNSILPLCKRPELTLSCSGHFLPLFGVRSRYTFDTRLLELGCDGACDIWDQMWTEEPGRSYSSGDGSSGNPAMEGLTCGRIFTTEEGCLTAGGGDSPMYSVIPDELRKPHVRPGPTRPFIRYHSDYRVFSFGWGYGGEHLPDYCLPVNFGDRFGLQGEVTTYPLPATLDNTTLKYKGCFLVDVYRNTGLGPDDPHYYAGPQPLTKAFDAIATVLNRFIELGDENSRFGLVGFDSHALAFNLSPEIRSFSPRKAAELLSVVDTSDPANQIQRFLFPFPDSHAANYEYYSRSNIEAGLRRALEGLQAHGGTGKNRVVLVSDGLADCYDYDDQRWPRCYDSGGGNGTMAHIAVRTAAEMAGSGVSVDVLHIPNDAWNSDTTGAMTPPHTLNIPSAEYVECCESAGVSLSHGSVLQVACDPACESIRRWKTTAEALAEGVDLVEQYRPGGGIQWTPAMTMWGLAKNTTGKYLPLREPGPANSCDTPTGENACAGPGTEPGGPCAPRTYTTTPCRVPPNRHRVIPSNWPPVFS